MSIIISLITFLVNDFYAFIWIQEISKTIDNLLKVKSIVDVFCTNKFFKIMNRKICLFLKGSVQFFRGFFHQKNGLRLMPLSLLFWRPFVSQSISI